MSIALFNPLTVGQSQAVSFASVCSFYPNVLQGMQDACGLTLERVLDHDIHTKDIVAMRFVKFIAWNESNARATKYLYNWQVFVQWLDDSVVKVGYVVFSRFIASRSAALHSKKTINGCRELMSYLSLRRALNDDFQFQFSLINHAAATVQKPLNEAWKRYRKAQASFNYATKAVAELQVLVGYGTYPIYSVQLVDAQNWLAYATTEFANATSTLLQAGGEL